MPITRTTERRRPRLRLVPALAAGFAVVGCARPAAPDSRPVLAVTIAPLADLVARVAGPGWNVRTIIPPGTSPHVFEPAPRDIRALAPARLVVFVGAGYDDWIRRATAACASRAELFDAGASVGVVAEAGNGEHGGDGHAHGEPGHDPHWWLSAQLAARAMAPLAARLTSLDPKGRAGYDARARDVADALLRLDAELSATLAPVRGRPFVTAHNAWTYFAARYGLVAAASIEPVPGREPSPRELKALVEGARSRHLRAIFTEPQFSASAARVIASDAGLVLESVDPFGGVAGRKSYDDMMRWNARAFVRGLS